MIEDIFKTREYQRLKKQIAIVSTCTNEHIFPFNQTLATIRCYLETSNYAMLITRMIAIKTRLNNYIHGVVQRVETVAVAT